MPDSVNSIVSSSPRVTIYDDVDEVKKFDEGEIISRPDDGSGGPLFLARSCCAAAFLILPLVCSSQPARPIYCKLCVTRSPSKRIAAL